MTEFNGKKIVQRKGHMFLERVCQCLKREERVYLERVCLNAKSVCLNASVSYVVIVAARAVSVKDLRISKDMTSHLTNLTTIAKDTLKNGLVLLFFDLVQFNDVKAESG